MTSQKVWVILNTRTLKMQVFSTKNKALFWLGVLKFIDGNNYQLQKVEVQ